MAEMKAGYKQTDIGVIPEDWDVKPIGQTLKIHHGKSQKEIEVSMGKYPILATGGKIGSTNSYLHSKPSVLIGRKGTIDKPQYIETPFWTVDTLFWSELLGSNSAKFMYYIFCLINWQQYNEASGVPSLNARTIEQVQIPVPKPEEQKQIAAALSDVDGLIESLEKLIAKKRNMKTAVMQQLLTGKKRLPGFDGEWEEKRIDEFGFFKSGNGFPTKYQGHQQGDYPFFKVSDMNNFGNATHMTASNNYISHKIAKTLSVNIIPEKSIIFAKIGAAIFLERKKITVQQSCIDNNMMAFIPDHHISDYTFFHYLFLHLTFGRLVAATALPSLSPKDIGGLALYIPKKNEQTAIAAILSDMDTEIGALEQRLDKARSLKTGMMQELLTGRTRFIKTNKKQEAA